MPKETVRGADYKFIPLPENADASTQWDPECRLGAIEVGWSKYPTGHVELASSDEVALRVLVEELTKKIRKTLDNGGGGAENEVEEAAAQVVRQFFDHGGFWVALDRDGCNALIKKIRKARDDAFGRDE